MITVRRGYAYAKIDFIALVYILKNVAIHYPVDGKLYLHNLFEKMVKLIRLFKYKESRELIDNLIIVDGE